MTGVRRLLWALRALALLLALALAALVWLTVPSADNGPFMTPLAVTLVAFVTVLVLLGYAGGLRDGRAAAATPSPEAPGDERR